MTISKLANDLRKRRVSSRELTTEALRKAKAHGELNAVITFTEDSALSEAEELDRELALGKDRGPLHGIPIFHKDNFETRGVRTTAGSLLYRDFIPARDADVVRRLRDGGCVSLGKTNMHELAFGITSKNPHYGSVLNPVRTTQIAGGSSGGSAAVIAAGFVALATGTDTGGSLRIPASYCGVVGFKPTYGRVSVRGVVPLSWGLDAAGVLGATVNDCALGFRAIASTYRDTPRPSRLRIGVASGYFDRIDAAVRGVIEPACRAIEAAGHTLELAALPDLEGMNAVSRVVQLAETAALYSSRRDASQFGADVGALIEQGRQLAAYEYVNAQRLRGVYLRAIAKLWKRFDLLVTPATPVTAPALASETVVVDGVEEDVRLASTRLVRSFNMLGYPAISIPCGLAENGLPVGLQLVAAAGRDEFLLKAADAISTLLG